MTLRKMHTCKNYSDVAWQLACDKKTDTYEPLTYLLFERNNAT